MTRQASSFGYDAAGNITLLARPGGRTTSYGYDNNYNLTSVTDPMGYAWQAVYDKDGLVTRWTDALGRSENWAYDADGRVVAYTNKKGDTNGYEYGPHGNVVTLTDFMGVKSHFEYDANDNLVKVTDPLGNVTKYDYDVMGNMTSYVDARGKVTKYTYDLEGNLTSREKRALSELLARKRNQEVSTGGGGAPSPGQDPNNKGLTELVKTAVKMTKDTIATIEAAKTVVQGGTAGAVGNFLSENEKRVYVPSPKHAAGGWGSVNPIPNNEIGQALLDSAYSSSGTKQLYNIYNGDIIKFQPDGYSGEWHAYRVKNTKIEVSTDVYRQMLEDGVINKSEYNKLIHNKWYKD